MLSKAKIQQLTDIFINLSLTEQQIIALKILCWQYGDEKKLIITIKNSSLINEGEYQALLTRLMGLGFSQTKSGFVIHEELHHPLLSLMTNEGMAWVSQMVAELYGVKFVELSGSEYYDRPRHAQNRALLMNAVYANKVDYFVSGNDYIGYCNKLSQDLRDIFMTVSINISWLESRNMIIRQYLIVSLLSNYYCDSQPHCNNNEILVLLAQTKNDEIVHDYLNYYSALIYVAIGRIETALEYCARITDAKSGYIFAIQATVAFLMNNFEAASKLYRKALTAIRRQQDMRFYYFDNIIGIFHNFCLAYVDKNPSATLPNAVNYDKYTAHTWAMPMGGVYWLFGAIILIEKGDQRAAQQELVVRIKNADLLHNPLLVGVYYALSYMANKNFIFEHKSNIVKDVKKSVNQTQYLATQLFYELLITHETPTPEATIFFENTKIPLRLLNFIQIKDSWEYSFQALEGLLLNAEQCQTMPASSKRLLWLIDPDRQAVDVVEQTLGKSYQWSKGRSINLEKLKNHHGQECFEYLSAQDKLAINGIVDGDNGWYSSYWAWSPYVTILALVGHPNIVHAKNRDVAIELVQGDPELHIEDHKEGFKLSLSHFLSEPGLIIEPESIGKYKIIDFSTSFVNIGRVISKDGLVLPANAKDQVLRVIQHAKRDIKIHVGINDINIPEIAGDSTPCIQLLPVNAGVRATLWVKPIINHGSYFKIAQGKDNFMTLVPEAGVEVRTRIQRDFKSEKLHQKALFAACPNLSRHEYDTDEYEIESPEDVLEVLSELQQYATDKPLTIEWPQGQAFKIKQRVNGRSLSLNITSNSNWFQYSGAVTLDDGDVIHMEDLLESLQNNSYGRFVRLGNGEFIELTGQLKKQLSMLHALSDNQKINPLGAQVLSDIVAQVENATFDAGWTAHVKKVKKMHLHQPSVPSTLKATLRDYQIEGFQYLSRLTHWGMGACLADDMGLGKTIQTIALLLERGKQGPSLVVAPTSVCFNWIEELIKFAPTLNVYDLRSDDKAGLIENAGAFDVVICSYGLLQHHGDLLIDKLWETIVLDEAQAIKNAQTQRWKTVMKLKGTSRIALSGTPIENHLGELWSIFSFINPGLLGSVKSFQTKYSTPIETKQIPDRIHALRSLVEPYLLRRIKSEVLTELPPKTEQTIHVEQTAAEAAFYEALRRKAEENMANFMAVNDRISVLAEITKLRLACCDSRLVDASLAIENSKLNSCVETLKNIIENGHKALIFSQYVSFLKIVRERMDAEGISYQYLDGSTSPNARKQGVAAFQSGEGDVFLLSLKAGGSGLNLTAADYVIHLDPWWNPAVEDQASDRAHRIGQERPVTIYRFVMQNSIEEKIIALHEHKRNLANDLLSGQGISGKLSNDDLINLISNSHGVG